MKKSIKSNLTYSILYQILVMIMPFITSPYLSRVLGPEKSGIFSESNALAYYFFIFAMLGVNHYGNREISKNRDNKNKLSNTFWQIYYIQFFLTFVMLFFYIIIINFTINDNQIIYLIQAIYITSALFDINWFASGLEEFKITTLRSAFIKILTMILIFIFVKNPSDLWKYTIIMTFGNVVGLLIIWPLVLTNTKFKRPNFNEIKLHIIPNLILFIPFIASSMYQQMDKILLGVLTNSKEVGFYNYAQSIILMTMAIMTGINSVLLPRMSNLANRNSKSEFFSLLNQSILYTTILNIALMFGILGIANDFIPFYLGELYSYTAELVILLAITIPLSGFSNIIRVTYLIPFNKEKIYVSSIIIGAFSDVLINLLLIPSIGAIGTCIASILTFFIVSLIQFIFTMKEINYKLFIKSLIYFIILGFFMYLVINSIHFQNVILLIVIKIIIGFFIYSLGTFIFLFLIKNEFFLKVVYNVYKKINTLLKRL